MSDPVSPAFADAFRSQADEAGRMSFERFMDLALFHEDLGYYRRKRVRVGKETGTDFVTASSTGRLFGELVVAAAVKLLAERNETPGTLAFIELGAETEEGILAGVAHPFASAHTLRLGAPLEPRGKAVVFSNELFDAQPCRRFRRQDGGWCELGVTLAPDGHLSECLLEPVSEDWLPPEAPEGYTFDAPRAAAKLAEGIAAPGWSGLFLAFDYGKSLEILAKECPFGTTRAYYRHTQEKNLLARPGEQDLTCHVCWDWISGALQARGFSTPVLESQEAFFVHHASDFIGAQVAADAGKPTQRKMALFQLIHPGNMGQKFQALHAWRG